MLTRRATPCVSEIDDANLVLHDDVVEVVAGPSQQQTAGVVLAAKPDASARLRKVGELPQCRIELTRQQARGELAIGAPPGAPYAVRYAPIAEMQIDIAAWRYLD